MAEFSSRQLRGFLLVARHRSFSRAAEALLLTPSGVSVLIRELETQLGFRLFDRTTRQVALTSYGQHLFTVAQKIMEEFDLAAGQIGRSATVANQSLSLGATPLVAAHILPRAVNEFRSHRPDVRIQLFEADPPTILRRVLTGKLDVGLGAFFKNAVGIRRTPFFRFALMVIRSDNDPAFRPASTTWSALKGEALITLPPSNAVQRLVDRHIAQAGVDFPHRIALNYLDTVIAMVEAGEGIAIVPSFALPACRNRRVVMSQLTNPIVNLDFYQITNRGKKLHAGAEDFTSFLQSYIARWAGRAGVL